MDYYINQLKCEWVWFWNIKHIWETLEVLNASFSVALLLHRKNIGHNISNNTSIWDVSDDLFGGKRNQISWRFKQMSCKTSAKYSIDAEFLPVSIWSTLYITWLLWSAFLCRGLLANWSKEAFSIKPSNPPCSTCWSQMTSKSLWDALQCYMCYTTALLNRKCTHWVITLLQGLNNGTEFHIRKWRNKWWIVQLQWLDFERVAIHDINI